MSRKRRNLVFALLLLVLIPFILACGASTAEGGRQRVAAAPPQRETVVETPPAKNGVVDKVYVVVSGDTFFRIAKNHGFSVEELAKYNNIINPSLIHPGDEIRIPGSSGGSSPPPAKIEPTPQPLPPAPTQVAKPLPTPTLTRGQRGERYKQYLHRTIFDVREPTCTQNYDGLIVKSWGDETYNIEDLAAIRSVLNANNLEEVYVYYDDRANANRFDVAGIAYKDLRRIYVNINPKVCDAFCVRHEIGHQSCYNDDDESEPCANRKAKEVRKFPVSRISCD